MLRVPTDPDHNWTEECFPRHSRFYIRREDFKRFTIDEGVIIACVFSFLALIVILMKEKPL